MLILVSVLICVLFLYIGYILSWSFGLAFTKMQAAATHKYCESGDCNGFHFDPQVDFAQFLEEARRHASRGHLDAHLSCSQEAERSKEKREKKTWKSSLVSWWKRERKTNPRVELASIAQNSHTRLGGYAFGPIMQNDEVAKVGQQRSTSGPLSSILHPTKKVEADFPYVCLDHHLNKTPNIHSYGPIYLVT
ncbi:hypothetical protein RJ641_023881 [Dillenia turbinata]|uniref:Uncharacterized protein n=1 Tax=Dillenia turbinata TaxID=194707 RepID=A0AAN8UJK3_9MAGN